MRKIKDTVLYILGFFPEFLFKLQYLKNTGRLIHTKHPRTLYDKIACMMFYTDTSKWSLLADKVAVRSFIEQHGFGKNMPKILGVWDDANNIDFISLPKQFVIKTNNASATNIIVTDRDKLDIIKTINTLNKWLAKDYGHYTAQPHYSKIKPLILAEEFLIDDKTTKVGNLLIDYKFYCINGEPRYVQVMYDRKPNTHDLKLQVFDMDWVAHPEFVSDIHDHSNTNLNKPESFEEMKAFVKSLSSDFKFVRVDLYEINGKPIFGELTFTPGFDSFTPSFMEILGKDIKVQ